MTNGVTLGGRDAKFSNLKTWCYTSLLEVTRFWLGDLAWVNSTERELNGCVAILLSGTDLCNDTWSSLNNSDGNILLFASNTWVMPSFVPRMPLTAELCDCVVVISDPLELNLNVNAGWKIETHQ